MAHEIVTIERDIEGAGRDLALVDLADQMREPFRQGDAARADPDESQLFDSAVAFEDFVSDAGERTTHSLRIHDDRHRHLFASSQGRVKENGRDYSTARLAEAPPARRRPRSSRCLNTLATRSDGTRGLS
jgi:hypothetical protein